MEDVLKALQDAIKKENLNNVMDSCTVKVNKSGQAVRRRFNDGIKALDTVKKDKEEKSKEDKDDIVEIKIDEKAKKEDDDLFDGDISMQMDDIFDGDAEIANENEDVREIDSDFKDVFDQYEDGTNFEEFEQTIEEALISIGDIEEKIEEANVEIEEEKAKEEKEKRKKEKQEKIRKKKEAKAEAERAKRAEADRANDVDEEVTETDDIYDEDTEEELYAETSFKTNKSNRLIYAAAGGVVALIMIVLIVVFLFSGDDSDNQPVKIAQAKKVVPKQTEIKTGTPVPPRIKAPVPVKLIENHKPVEPTDIQGPTDTQGPVDTAEPVDNAAPIDTAEPADTSQPVDTDVTPVAPEQDRVEKAPVVPSPPEVSSQSDQEEEIKDFLMEWETAWEKTAGAGGDIDTYMTFFSDDFTAKGLNKKGWKQDKRYKNRRKEWININISNIKLDSKNDSSVIVSFTQDFKSSNYSEKSLIYLELKKEDTEWKIFSIPSPDEMIIADIPVTNGSTAYTQGVYPFTIHASSFRNVDAVTRSMDEMRPAGLEVYACEAEIPGKGLWYRVFMGHFRTMRDARAAASRCKRSINGFHGIPIKKPYAINLGAFTSAGELNKMMAELKRKGYTPYKIRDIRNSSKTWVLVGAFSSSGEAALINNQLQKSGFSPQVVRR